MKKLLPIFIFIVFFFSFLFLFNHPVSAQTGTESASGDTTTTEEVVGGWVADPEVTFVGKTGVRASDFLEWALLNYNWICVKHEADGTCNNAGDPLVTFWVVIRNIVYAMIALFVLVTAFIIVVTRGQNITVMRFIPRFVFIIVLITLSFSLIQFIYQVADIIQGFFLRINNTIIGPSNLLYLGFEYDFIGFRLQGNENNESAFVSLLLVKLTAITYYVMTGILLIRKIILWFFIIISPVFPLLIFYKPLRNTAKIWVGEFFRWLLYAPLFAIFLHGLVLIWQSPLGIPLAFDFSKVEVPKEGVIYPTAISILLGGPGQTVFYQGPEQSNSVNLPETFALYVVALLMLWVVIILPFILLKIFLDYISTLSLGNNVAIKSFMNKNLSFLSPNGGGGISPTPPPGPPGQSQPAGMARTLPFLSHKGAAVTPVQLQPSVAAAARESQDVLHLTNLSIPKMQDIARYETSMISNNITNKNEVNQMSSTLSKIANPNITTVSADRQKFSTVRQQLLSQKQKGNPIAASILNASQVATSSSVSSQVSANQSIASSILSASQTTSSTANVRQQQISNLNGTNVKQKLQQEKDKGNPVATSILEAQEKISKETQIEKKSEMESKLVEQLLTEEKKGDLPAEISSALHPEGGPVVTREQQISKVSEMLKNIANPASVTDVIEREKATKIKQKLLEEKQKNSTIATSILDASTQVTSTTTTEEQKQIIESKLVEQLLTEEKQGGSLPAEISSVLHPQGGPVVTHEQQVSDIHQILTKLSNPGAETNVAERTKITKIKENLLTEKQKGNTLATTILEASEQLSSSTLTQEQKTKIENKVLDELLIEEKKSVTTRVAPTANIPAMATSPGAPRLTQAALPQVNHVQQVSLEDYEEVRKLWTENYQTIEPPKALSGQQVERREWIKNDMDKITQAVALLNSADPAKVNQGMEMVANILPFLLIGGFSKTEVVAYLKAKMEAGKQVLADIIRKDDEDESMATTTKKKEAQSMEMSQAAEQKLVEEDDQDKNSPTGPAGGNRA